MIHKLTEVVIVSKQSDRCKCFIIDRLSDIEFKLSHTNDAEIQMYAIVSAFYQARTL